MSEKPIRTMAEPKHETCLVSATCKNWISSTCINDDVIARSVASWVDQYWNPVVGCWGVGGNRKAPNRCEYCYAHKIAGCYGHSDAEKNYEPAFHPDRLGEPSTFVTKSTIFVCPMGDLFGPWVPNKWIEAVLGVVSQNLQHTFVFRTRFPERYLFLDWPINVNLGTTVTNLPEWIHCNATMCRVQDMIARKTHLALEPFLFDTGLDDFLFDRWFPEYIVVGPLTCQKEEHKCSGEKLSILREKTESKDIKIFLKEAPRSKIGAPPSHEVFVGQAGC